MLVATTTHDDVRWTLEALVKMVNDATAHDLDVRAVLVDYGFSRAPEASNASIHRLAERFGDLIPLVQALPTMALDDAVRRINEELTELPISPAVVSHGGVGPHIHWTAPTTRFDDQVLADLMMAIAEELCAHGTDRFGSCAADGCERLFYDGTRNRSRRFCDDSRCASRTHTADHRARNRNGRS